MDFETIRPEPLHRVVTYSRKRQLVTSNQARSQVNHSEQQDSQVQQRDSTDELSTPCEDAYGGDSPEKILARKITTLEEALKTLRERQNENYKCPICWELLWQPYVLPCGHTVCARCLTKQAVKHLKTVSPSRTCRKMECMLCRGRIVRPPVLCYTLRDAVQSFAVDQGIQVPRHKPFHWPPKLPRCRRY
ncbi:hypothetical protein K435DRAFT_858537 [Dendrothele bispora CBS 962.96]|uniref:RING-type domain-containing protein n=1 Tax=Dendrothele bispora (strain CBS 962.96) TaxID=1314807 RepID=A0A4S8M362_DENBC|nr:hypothetical protein K435DRAFT_858537 [Dendrothele bispora CBS 962.96]